MSLLDVIKNLFFGEKSEKPAEEEQITSTVTEVEKTPVVEKEPIAAKAEPIAPVVVTKKKSTEPQIPEDSTLRRHYLANLEAQKQAAEVTEAQPVVAEKVAEPVVVETETAVETVAEETIIKVMIPEDSALKRHFIAALKTEIEANMPARPTDSALKRHYDTTVQAELDTLLS